MGYVKRQLEKDTDTWYLAVSKIFDEGHEHFAEFSGEVLKRLPHPNPNIPIEEVEEELEEYWGEKWSMLR